MKEILFYKYYKSFSIISLIAIVISIIFLLFKGLNYGVDFKGGTLIEIRTDLENSNISSIRESFKNMDLGDVSVKQFGKKNDFLVKFEKRNSNDPNFINNIKNDFQELFNGEFKFRRVENVGPKVSKELLNSGIIAISLSLIAMLFYIWIRFEWQFSLGAIVAIFHDVLLTLGIFSILSLEINLSIVAAVLTIVGYSMNDTVVIFDRVRENLKKSNKKIIEISNLSINETLSRTIITSLTTLLALFSIFFLGGEILKGFASAMILGVIFGTYSSIFVANSVLIFLRVSQRTVLKDSND